MDHHFPAVTSGKGWLARFGPRISRHWARLVSLQGDRCTSGSRPRLRRKRIADFPSTTKPKHRNRRRWDQWEHSARAIAVHAPRGHGLWNASRRALCRRIPAGQISLLPPPSHRQSPGPGRDLGGRNRAFSSAHCAIDSRSGRLDSVFQVSGASKFLQESMGVFMVSQPTRQEPNDRVRQGLQRRDGVIAIGRSSVKWLI